MQSWASPRGGDGGSDSEIFACQAVVGLAVVAGIGGDPPHASSRAGLAEQAGELDDVRTRTLPHAAGQDLMVRGVAQQAELGIVVVVGASSDIAGLAASSRVVLLYPGLEFA